MAIEIREILIRATVRLEGRGESKNLVTKAELKSEKRRILDECMDRVRDMLEDYRSGR
jgi:hypothetical protein